MLAGVSHHDLSAMVMASDMIGVHIKPRWSPIASAALLNCRACIWKAQRASRIRTAARSNRNAFGRGTIWPRPIRDPLALSAGE